MEYEISTYYGAGRMQLGMSVQQIESLYHLTPERIEKGSDEGFLTDVYEDFFVYYKSPGICNAIEFRSPAIVTYRGINLLNVPYELVNDFLRHIDAGLIADDEGLTSKKLGIGIYAPYAKCNPSAVTESVIIFEKGYYD